MDVANRIWKFPLTLNDEAEVEMPEGSEVISVDNQGGTICLWAICSPAMPTDIRRFAIVGTGNPMPTKLKKFIGTVIQHPFVWHVFEMKD